MIAFALVAALLGPDVAPSMPAEAAACVAALDAPDLATTADRFLPGPCSHTGAPPNQFSYVTQSEMPLAGDTGPTGEKVWLGDNARPISRHLMTGGRATLNTTLTYDGTRLVSEATTSLTKRCEETQKISYGFGMFGRPTLTTTLTVPCEGEPKTTTRTTEYKPDGTALIDGTRRWAKGLINNQWFSVECDGPACACERRTYDTHHNLLRTRSRDAKGAISEIRYDFACWPKKTPTSGPKAGDATKGAALYTANCQTCHGEKGYGDGPGAGALKVRNLASMGDAMCGQTPAIIHTIKHGVATMPGFPHLTNQQAHDLVAYVRELQRKK
jgi:mono/diheme cytochrome c family protein